MGFIFFTVLAIFLVIAGVSYIFYVSDKKKDVEIPPVFENPIIIDPIIEPSPKVETKKIIETVGLLTQEDVIELKKTKPVRRKSAPKKTSRKRK